MKNYGRESVNGDFPCAKLENAKKIAKNVFLATMKKPGTYIDNHIKPYLCTKFGDSSLKMSSGMPKEASSLNGPLCAYLMRQNLHDRTCPRS